MKKTTSARRLLKLAAFLEKLPTERFNYQFWVGKDWEGKADLSCGTTACALGWATTMPEFRRLGLQLVKLNSNYAFVVSARTGASAFGAAQEIFGLDQDESAYLFSPGILYHGEESPPRTATPREVASHIRDFVKRHR
jgi:hypothetical protein